MAAIKNITVYRGTAPKLRFGPVKDINGAVQNVNGWTTQLTVRKKDVTPDPPLLTKAGVVVGDGSGGYIDVSLTKAETLTLLAAGGDGTDYAYSLERIDSGSEDLLTIGTLTSKLDIKNPKA